jgi:hypothetical protein
MSSFISQTSACLKHTLVLRTSLLVVGGLTCRTTWKWRKNALILMQPIKVYTPFNLGSMHSTFLLQDITTFLLMITLLKMGSPARAHMNMT